MRLVYRPILSWPGTLTKDRKPSPFTADWRDTMALLERELDALGADEAVVQLEVAESAIRLDGSLRSDRKPPAHPGVILSFESRFGPMQYATDVFDRAYWRSGSEGWRQNLRAIALGLEALRKVDRYGISRRGEQYVGWKQLGAGSPMGAGSSTMTAEEAARFLIKHGEWGGAPAKPEDLIGEPHIVGLYYRSAAKRLHPDAGGSTEDFQRLQDVKRILDSVEHV